MTRVRLAARRGEPPVEGRACGAAQVSRTWPARRLRRDRSRTGAGRRRDQGQQRVAPRRSPCWNRGRRRSVARRRGRGLGGSAGVGLLDRVFHLLPSEFLRVRPAEGKHPPIPRVVRSRSDQVRSGPSPATIAIVCAIVSPAITIGVKNHDAVPTSSMNIKAPSPRPAPATHSVTTNAGDRGRWAGPPRPLQRPAASDRAISERRRPGSCRQRRPAPGTGSR